MISKEKIVEVDIEDEMKSAYLDYAMSVIIGRALPDVRDGLKPVHRRILYAMHELGLFHDKPFKKSARIVGEVLGKYHPHGDAAVYEAMVRMVQEFSLRYPLLMGQGNFGSIDGDAPAAMRYTEAKLSKISHEMLKDIEKETIRFVPNFDGTLKEPVVLPAKLPNILINGSTGIAVGMATTIPPHNIGEIIDGLIKVIDNPEISTNELLDVIKGPDFPTAGLILGGKSLKKIYETGHGTIIIRSCAEIVESKKGKKRIIVTELPYQVNKARLVEKIAELMEVKKITGISGLRDESDRDGIRIVIDLKRDVTPEIVLNQLYAHTNLQISFGVNLLALVDGVPKKLSLKEILVCFITHRKNVVTSRIRFDLKKAEERQHLVEGILIGLKNIDKVIEIIRAAHSNTVASQQLIENFNLTKEQANAILGMRLQTLTTIEREKLEEEHKELAKVIINFKEILADERKVMKIIKDELLELKDRYGDERKTRIIEEFKEFEAEDLIQNKEYVITITFRGYVKKMLVESYKRQKRGGKGVLSAKIKEEDFVQHFLIARALNYILLFTNQGQVFWLKVYNIPTSETRHSVGKSIVNLINLREGEKITSVMPIKEFDDNHYLFMVTKNGYVKKTVTSAFKRPMRKGIRAIGLKDDELIDVKLTDGSKRIFLASSNGMAIVFDESGVRSMGRSSYGVRGMRLGLTKAYGGYCFLSKNRYGLKWVNGISETATIIGASAIDKEDKDLSIVTITENGYGKRTLISHYRITHRGGKGIKNIKQTKKNGAVVGIKSVLPDDEILIITLAGQIIRVNVSDIPLMGRNTQGVRIIRLNENDKVVAIAKVS